MEGLNLNNPLLKEVHLREKKTLISEENLKYINKK